MTNNQKIYDSVEFSNFANRTDLLQEEELLLEKYFIRKKKPLKQVQLVGGFYLN